MTSEIVILNRNAVAMAADSAVTLSSGKIYNTANKMFMISSNHPIGVMIYNKTDFCGLPWEIIITDFGKYLCDPKIIHAPKLEDYFEEFNKWLANSIDKYCSLDQEKDIVEYITYNALIDIGQEIWKSIWDYYYKKAKKISEVMIIKSLKIILQKKIDGFKKVHEYFTDSEREQLKLKLSEDFKKMIKEQRNDLFKNIPLDEEDIKNIDEIIFLTITRDSSMYSGIVFVGYGDEELLPSCISYRYEDPICKFIKRIKIKDECLKISMNGIVAGIIPLAQKDVIHNFLSGMHPELYSILLKILKKKLSEKDLQEIFSKLNDQFISKHKNSILDAVNSLPKEELATMAETLVGLTSFMRKVSMDPDTVGGPVDVAVISRTDGFVWINKKMYFANDKNLHLRYNH